MLLLGLETAAILLLAKLLWDSRRRQRDLRAALQNRSPYLVDSTAGPFVGDWRETAAAANEVLAALHAAEAARRGRIDQLEATLGSLQEGVLVVDDTNSVILSNQAVSAIFPQAGPILGQRIEAVARSSTFAAFLDEVRRGVAAHRVEHEILGDSGSSWIEATGAVVRPWDGSKGNWVLCVLHEVTRQKQLEALRKEFVANVSHELRTPLSVIKGFMETLVDGHRDMAEADRDRFLRTVQRHTERLHVILEDLLTLSRLESRHPGLHLEPIDLGALIHEIAADYRQRSGASGHRIDVVVPPALPVLELDAVRIRQVFDNLLDNALKYTPAQSFITLRAEALAAGISVRIEDNGSGIPAKDLPHIFERFYRVDKGRSREKGGTGLGLSIVKHIVQLHGGRIWAESTVGKGTTIVFVLPAPAVPAGA